MKNVGWFCHKQYTSIFGLYGLLKYTMTYRQLWFVFIIKNLIAWLQSLMPCMKVKPFSFPWSKVRSHCVICFCLQWATIEPVMLSQSHSVDTSIESRTTHLLSYEESQSRLEKNALCEWAFKLWSWSESLTFDLFPSCADLSTCNVISLIARLQNWSDNPCNCDP